MRARSRRQHLTAGLLAAIAVSACTPVAPAPSTSARAALRSEPAPTSLPAGARARVDRVVDGDTVIVSGRRVRLIGIDAPESVKPDSPVECFGPEAAEELRRLLPRRTPVLLEYDLERTDRYGRTLAYVWRTDPVLMVNLALVRDGFATVYTFPPNVRHVTALEQAEASARAEQAGLWTACP